MEREAGEGKKLLEAMKGEVEKFRRNVAESRWSADKEKEREVALKTANTQVRQFTEVSLSPYLER